MVKKLKDGSYTVEYGSGLTWTRYQGYRVTVPCKENYEIIAKWALHGVYGDDGFYGVRRKKYAFVTELSSRYWAEKYALKWRNIGFLAIVVRKSDSNRPRYLVYVRGMSECRF